MHSLYRHTVKSIDCELGIIAKFFIHMWLYEKFLYKGETIQMSIYLHNYN